MSTNSRPSFWDCIGLQETDRNKCRRAVQDLYPGCYFEEVREQGYCSYTLLVSPANALSTPNRAESHHNDRLPSRERGKSMIVQIRPSQHALDLSIAQAATAMYPSLAPTLRSLHINLPRRLHAYEMDRLHGTPFSHLQPRNRVLGTALQSKQRRLIESFAAFIAQGWQSNSKSQSRDRNLRADSPMENTSEMLSQCTGKIGSSIIDRLEKLGEDLPEASLRQRAKTVLAYVMSMNEYPVVLNHGDLIPSNILVDEDTWEITGLVDWAEAEYLPFGSCLYGLELLLGYIIPGPSPLSGPDDDTSNACDRPAFIYYDHTPPLRERLLTRLSEAIPELKGRQEEMQAMRDMGVLLWYGYAWDDGAIDRVVNETDDAKELACLRAFLNTT